MLGKQMFERGDIVRAIWQPHLCQTLDETLLMFFLSRCFGPSYSRNLRRYALAAPKSPTPRTFDTIQKLEQDHAQLLRVVESRVVERTSLLSQVSTCCSIPQITLKLPKLSEEMSAPEDIVHLKKIKESAPLQAAWDDWIRARQVNHIILF